MTSTTSQRLLGDRVRSRFRELCGEGEDAPRVFFAPGRINLIGAHLDYNGGDVLPLAVDRGVAVAARLRRDGRLRFASLDLGPSVELDLRDVGDRRDARHGWAAYPIGVWKAYAERSGLSDGVDMVFAGDVPMASGMSSSAALEVATAYALDSLHGRALPVEELAMVAHRAETGYVGVQCGIMDQFASALGRDGHLLLLHCHDRSFEHVPFDPDGFEVLVMDTKKPRTLAGSEFNVRVEQVGRAHRVLRQAVRDLPALAHYTQADIDAAGDALDEVLRRRARHVVTEMERVREAVAALRAGDVATVGAMLTASTRSAAEDYEVSCEELDVITAAATEHEDCFGARLTGAGFGGCAIALVRPGAADAVSAHVGEVFGERFGVVPGFEVLHPGGGPRALG